ncbi:hypothetical protein Tco_0706586 [Tanacetum coccineum]|uniref:Uncharacterized protein n=1 Tax=Tanacetum coccineum TaxID=301880 RepID=A0ABQ4Y8P2_9ASTR
MDVRRIKEKVDPDFLSDAHSRTSPAGQGDSCESKVRSFPEVFYGGGSLEAVGMVVEKTSAKKLIQPSGKHVLGDMQSWPELSFVDACVPFAVVAAVFYGGGSLEAMGITVEKTSAKKLIQPSGKHVFGDMQVFYGVGSLEAVGMVVEKTSAKKLIQPSGKHVLGDMQPWPETYTKTREFVVDFVTLFSIAVIDLYVKLLSELLATVFYGVGSLEAVGMVVEKTSAKKLIQPSGKHVLGDMQEKGRGLGTYDMVNLGNCGLGETRKRFKTLSLDESRLPDFDLFSDQEEYSEDGVAKIMAETMEQYMRKTQADYGSGVARPKIEDNDNFELKGQFIEELHTNTFSGSDHEDANEHIEKVLKIVDLFHIPNITID